MKCVKYVPVPAVVGLGVAYLMSIPAYTKPTFTRKNALLTSSERTLLTVIAR